MFVTRQLRGMPASNLIFASSRLKGRRPRTASILFADHLRPAAIAAGVVLKPGQRFGFHNLRHSLATFLTNKELDAKTMHGLVEAQESMLKAILRNSANKVN